MQEPGMKAYTEESAAVAQRTARAARSRASQLAQDLGDWVSSQAGMHDRNRKPRLIPTVYNVVVTGDDPSQVREAVGRHVKRYEDNPVVKDLKDGRRSLESHAADLTEHRDSLTGLLTAPGYDADHNERVRLVDDVIPFESTHTRKPGVLENLLHEERLLAAGTVAGISSFGFLSDNPGLAAPVLALTALFTGAAAVTYEDEDVFSDAYKQVARRGDQVWEEYVENQNYEANIARPALHRPRLNWPTLQRGEAGVEPRFKTRHGYQ